MDYKRRSQQGRSVNQAVVHAAYRYAPGEQGEAEKEGEAEDVDCLVAEGAAADQFDQLVKRVDLGHHLHALGQAFDWEEGPGDEEERRDAERGDVVELVDLGHGRR